LLLPSAFASAAAAAAVAAAAASAAAAATPSASALDAPAVNASPSSKRGRKRVHDEHECACTTWRDILSAHPPALQRGSVARYDVATKRCMERVKGAQKRKPAALRETLTEARRSYRAAHPEEAKAADAQADAEAAATAGAAMDAVAPSLAAAALAMPLLPSLLSAAAPPAVPSSLSAVGAAGLTRASVAASSVDGDASGNGDSGPEMKDNDDVRSSDEVATAKRG
jgi:hypothetical protein